MRKKGEFNKNFPKAQLFIIKDFEILFKNIFFFLVLKYLSLHEMTIMKNSTMDGRI